MSYPHETWSKFSTHEAIILTKFHEDRVKIVNSLVKVNFGICAVFYDPDFRISFLQQSQLAWTGQKLLKKMTAKYDDIFGTYEHSWVGRKWFFLKLCLATRGRCNHFSQNWNFELKIFLDIHFMTKIGSMGLWIYCLSKNESKWPKDHTCNIFRPSSKILKWAKFLKFEAFKHCGSNF